MRSMTEETRPRYGFLVVSVLVLLGGGGACRVGVDEDFDRGTRLVYELDLRGVPDNVENAAAATREGIRKRLIALGARQFRLRLEGIARLVVEIRDQDDAVISMVRRAVEVGGRLTFHLVADTDVPEIPFAHHERAEEELREAQARWVGALSEWRERREADPNSAGPRPPAPGRPVYVVRSLRSVSGRDAEGAFPSFETKERKLLLENGPESVVSGRLIESAARTLDHDVRPAVVVAFSEEGAAAMGELTADHLGRQLAIVLDDEVLSAPVIQSRITRDAMITGRFSEAEVLALVAILRTAPIPVRPELIKREEFGPESESAPSPRPDEAPVP